MRKFSEGKTGLTVTAHHRLPFQPPRLSDLMQVAVVTSNPKDDEAKGLVVVDSDEVVLGFEFPTLREAKGKAMKQVSDFATRNQLLQRRLLRL